MILIGASMADKNCILSFCMIGLFCSMVFSENDILWDFGVIIKQPGLHNSSKKISYQHPAKQKIFQTNINAVIADPFIPPVRSSLSPEVSDPLGYKLSEDLKALTLKKNINQIRSIAEKYYLKKNYWYVIQLLHHRNLDLLSGQNRSNIEYLLADAFYHAGEYNRAREYVLSLLKQNKSDRLYLLLAMIYESLGEKNPAKQQYLKLISQFPDSDYFISAKIKSKILGQH